MRLISSSLCRRSVLAVLSTLAAVYGQGTISVSPSPVFLNATLNGAAVTVNVSVISGAGNVTVGAPAVSWLSINPTSSSSPATLTFTGNPSGMAVGTYNTNVTISDPTGGNVSVPVVMTVNNTGAAVSASPSGLVFNFAQGSATPSSQPLSISSTTPLTFTLSGSTGWITLSATSGQASPGNASSLSIGVNPAAAGGPGIYTGSVTITPSTGNAILVPVVLQITSTAQLTASVSSLSFNVAASAPNNVVQKTITLTSSGSPINFSAVGSVLTTSNGAQWLSVSPLTSATPATLTVSVSPSGLPTGTYQGSVNIGANDASGASLRIPVSLLVSAQPILDVNPTSLSFSFSAGGPAPAHQLVTPTTTPPGQPYTVSTSTSTGSWLKASASGVTPAPIDVFVDPTGLGTGTYVGTVTINVPNAINSPQTVNVTLTITNNPTLTSPNATAGLTFNYELGQGLPAAQSASINSTTGNPLAFNVSTVQTNTSNNVTWLLASSPSSSVTPATFSVAVNPSGMTAGRYTGAVVVNTPGGSPLSIPVTLNVANVGSPLLNVNPSAITFNSASGGGVNPQSVTVTSTGETVGYTVTSAISSPAGGSWLIVGSPSGPATAGVPSSFFVSVNANGLTTGTYSGSVTVQPANGNPAVIVPVTLNITTTSLTVSPNFLTFTQPFGGAAPGQQSISVASSGTSVPFNATVSNATWLTVSPSAGNTPATLTVSVNAAGLQPGNYSGQIVVNATGAANGQQIVTVNLSITVSQTLSVTPTAMLFTSISGAGNPPAQTAQLTASGGVSSFTALASVSAPFLGSWLSVTPTTGTASQIPTPLTVSVNPTGLAPGTYTGTITINSAGASNTQTINVTYTLSSLPTPVVSTIWNAASLQPGAVAAGELITLKGSNLGPGTPITSAITPGTTLPTQVVGTQVTFDGIPAPLLYVSSVQVNTIVPYGIAGRVQTQMVITVNGVSAPPIALRVTDSSPAIFFENLPTVPVSQGAILNADGSLNSPQNPAARGTSIAIFATGEGTTNAPGIDGLVTPIDPNSLKHPVQAVHVFIGGQEAELQYAGSAPGLVNGMFQVNVKIPDTVPAGPTIGIAIQVGNNSSPDIVTLALQ